MKRKSTATGLLTLVALVLLGVVSAGSASAHDFTWTGSLAALILVLSDNLQVFEAVAGLDVTCSHFKGHGVLSNGTQMTVKTAKVIGQYTGCTAGKGAFAATVTPAEYEFSADESVAVINKPIVVTIPGIGCSLKISNGAPNNNIKTIKYLVRPNDLLVHVEAIKITSVGSAEPCGPPETPQPNGVYRGLLLVGLDGGGSLKWV